MCQRDNQYTETFRSSQSGFPLLAPTMQAGQDSDEGVGDSEETCTLEAVMVLCFIFDEESFSKMFLSVSDRVIRLRLTLGISSAFYYYSFRRSMMISRGGQNL